MGLADDSTGNCSSQAISASHIASLSTIGRPSQYRLWRDTRRPDEKNSSSRSTTDLFSTPGSHLRDRPHLIPDTPPLPWRRDAGRRRGLLRQFDRAVHAEPRAHRAREALGEGALRLDISARVELIGPCAGVDFANEAKARGVLLKPADVFATAQPIPDAIRICTCAARSAADLDRALDIVVDLMRAGPAPALSVV